MKALYLRAHGGARRSYLGNSSSTSVPEPEGQNKSHRRYQLHLWISQKEYSTLKALAQEEDEPMTRIVRRLIRKLQLQS
jgi:hypothetical protein